MTPDRANILQGQIRGLQHSNRMLLFTHPTTKQVGTVLFDEEEFDYVLIDDKGRYYSGLDSYKMLDELIRRGYINENGSCQMEVRK